MHWYQHHCDNHPHNQVKAGESASKHLSGISRTLERCPDIDVSGVSVRASLFHPLHYLDAYWSLSNICLQRNWNPRACTYLVETTQDLQSMEYSSYKQNKGVELSRRKGVTATKISTWVMRMTRQACDRMTIIVSTMTTPAQTNKQGVL